MNPGWKVTFTFFPTFTAFTFSGGCGTSWYVLKYEYTFFNSNGGFQISDLSKNWIWKIQKVGSKRLNVCSHNCMNRNFIYSGEEQIMEPITSYKISICLIFILMERMKIEFWISKRSNPRISDWTILKIPGL